MFPVISCLDDVLPSLIGHDEFSVTDKGDYTVICYHVNKPDSFDDPIRRECRGIIFDKAGKIIRRPLHKFFNIGEREDTQPHVLPFDQPHVIYDKLDGTMISPFLVNGRLIWGTKAGETEFSPIVEAWVEKHPQYKAYALKCLQQNLTPIFEWLSPDNRIVVKHQVERLVLLTTRHMHDGHYYSHSEVEGFALATVKVYDSVTDVNKFIEDTRALTDTEGFVVAFVSGERVKLKCDWYVQIHKARERMEQEYNIVQLILNNEIDDVIAHLPDDQKEETNTFINWFWDTLGCLDEEVLKHYVLAREMSRKDFALSTGDMPKLLRAMVFAKLDGKYDVVRPVLEKHLTSNSRWLQFKELLNGNY